MQSQAATTATTATTDVVVAPAAPAAPTFKTDNKQTMEDKISKWEKNIQPITNPKLQAQFD